MVDRSDMLMVELLELTGRADRATDRSRKCIELAVLAAQDTASPVIDSRHLLCGLMREGHGVAFHILDRMGLGCESIERELANSATVGDSSHMAAD